MESKPESKKATGIKAGRVWVSTDCWRVFVTINSHVPKRCSHCEGGSGRRPETDLTLVVDRPPVLRWHLDAVPVPEVSAEDRAISGQELKLDVKADPEDGTAGFAPNMPDPQVDWNAGTATDLHAKPKTLAETLRQG